MLKITGLDRLQRELREAEKAFRGLDSDLGTVSFDPHDPGSIDAAMNAVDRMVDTRLGSYASNTIVGPMAEQMKQKYREAILEKAAAARLGSE